MFNTSRVFARARSLAGGIQKKAEVEGLSAAHNGWMSGASLGLAAGALWHNLSGKSKSLLRSMLGGMVIGGLAGEGIGRAMGGAANGLVKMVNEMKPSIEITGKVRTSNY